MSPSEALLDLLDRISCGAVLLDRAGRMIAANAAAQACLTDMAGEGQGEALPNDSWANDLLRQLIKDAPHRQGPPARARPLPKRAGRPLLAYAWSFPWSEDGGPKPVLILIDLDQRPEPGEALLRQLFAVTGAEAKLAARMVTGRSLDDIAGELRISMGTARTQLSAIFAKTHTSRQAELVALLGRVALLRFNHRL